MSCFIYKPNLNKITKKTEKIYMRFLALPILLLALLFSSDASAWYVTIHGEPEDATRENGIVFPLTNNTSRDIELVYGWVYRYAPEEPKNIFLVSNPHVPATRITPGPHKPGEKALYWFKVPQYHIKPDKYGVVIYDASIRFARF